MAQRHILPKRRPVERWGGLSHEREPLYHSPVALLESLSSISLGSPMPDFILPDTLGTSHCGANRCGAKGLLVVFTCNHCPYAQALWPRLLRLAQEFKSQGIETVAINPNIHPEYPEDSPAAMKNKIAELNIWFPYLVDESQDVARRFQAQCTPDIYLYDSGQKLVYHGRVDDNWKSETQAKRHELRQALLALCQGKPVDPRQHPSMGCSIKWQS